MLLKNNNLHILFFDSTQHRIYLHFSELHRIRCCLPYKGTNFSANHNLSANSSTMAGDVVYPTKVRIFQQITTKHTTAMRHPRMLFTLQRYEFFSKSQQGSSPRSPPNRCCLPYKGTNFSANHNTSNIDVNLIKMLFTLQRYEFFSKSQQQDLVRKEKN